jgi:lysophospholipase L1-like esterase
MNVSVKSNTDTSRSGQVLRSLKICAGVVLVVYVAVMGLSFRTLVFPTNGGEVEAEAFEQVVAGDGKVYVSCVGDSLTRGFRATNSYPEVLQNTLGEHYVVSNFGFNGANMLKAAPVAYWDLPMYQEFLNQSKVDFAIVMFGANDARQQAWESHGSEFEADYEDFINRIRQRFGSETRILIMATSPLYRPNYPFESQIVNTVLPKVIHDLGSKLGLQVVDVFNLFGGAELSHPEYFSDGLHFTEKGNVLLGEYVAKAIESAG